MWVLYCIYFMHITLTLPLSQLCPPRLSLFLPLPFLSLNVVCFDGFDVASMSLLRCRCGLLRSVYYGSSGGLAWWAVGYGLQILDLGWFGRFSGYFPRWIMWLWRFLGIFWVDRCIMSQAPIDVALTFFWVDHRSFSGYFRRLEFQIGGVGFWSVAWVCWSVA